MKYERIEKKISIHLYQINILSVDKYRFFSFNFHHLQKRCSEFRIHQYYWGNLINRNENHENLYIHIHTHIY